MDVEDARSAEARVGSVLAGKYRLDRLLGAGGMGAVYAAVNTWTGRHVAIKLMRPEFTANREAASRFMQEARIAAQVEHPNVVEILDLGIDAPDGSLYIVQEFLTGADLRHEMHGRGRLTVDEALEVLVPIMGALVAVHRRGVVHRDLKPENIFLARRTGTEVVPKLLDFGVSKVLKQSEALAKTRTGAALGTPYYMSPEQARGDRAVDERTDVWAIGAVLFEALAGCVPLDAPTYNLLMLRVMTERPPALVEVAPDVPAALSTVIARALEPDLNRRYAPMQQFLGALLDCPLAEGTRRGERLIERHRQSISDALAPPPPRRPVGLGDDREAARRERQDLASPALAAGPQDGSADQGSGRLQAAPRFSTTMAVTSSSGLRDARLGSARPRTWLLTAAVAMLAIGGGILAISHTRRSSAPEPVPLTQAPGPPTPSAPPPRREASSAPARPSKNDPTPGDVSPALTVVPAPSPDQPATRPAPPSRGAMRRSGAPAARGQRAHSTPAAPAPLQVRRSYE